jgi:hypothetical protein
MSLSLGERVFVIPPTILAAFWATAGSSKRACKNGKNWVYISMETSYFWIWLSALSSIEDFLFLVRILVRASERLVDNQQ